MTITRATLSAVNAANPRPARPRNNDAIRATGKWTPNGLMLSDARGISTIDRARHIKRTLGLNAAAKFLRTRGWSVEAAAYYLTQRGGR